MPKTVEFHTRLAASLEAVVAFHEDARALIMLTPPPIIVQLVRNERTSLTSGDVAFIMWFGPLPVRWLARHEPGPTEHSFIDRMITGPMESWQHEHIFQPIDGQVELIDRVTLAHKPGLPGLFSRLVFDGLPLRFLFFYRHWRTKRALRGK